MKTSVLDTNILLYALDEDSEYHQAAKALLEDESCDLFLTTKTISEYFAVASKLNIPLEKAMIFYRSFCENAQILFPNLNSLIVFEDMLQKYQPRGNRVFDLEIAALAIAHEMDEIRTVNTKDFADVTEIAVRSI